MLQAFYLLTLVIWDIASSAVLFRAKIFEEFFLVSIWIKNRLMAGMKMIQARRMAYLSQLPCLSYLPCLCNEGTLCYKHLIYLPWLYGTLPPQQYYFQLKCFEEFFLVSIRIKNRLMADIKMIQARRIA